MPADRPWSAQIELSEGCNRICPFCGINGIRTKPGNYKYMTVEAGQRIAAEFGRFMPTARYEFAMHGEPLMNPDALEILRGFRQALPDAQIQVTTNGRRLMRRMQQGLEELFEVVDFVIMDTYYPERDKLREEAATLQGIDVKDFYDDCLPSGWSPYHNHRRKANRVLVLMDDIGVRDGEHSSRKLYNHAGNMYLMDPLLQPLAKVCTLPFREISVCWNGHVNICCMDWGHEYTAGNLLDNTIEEVWHSDAFEAARAVLYQRDRRMSPCARCNYNRPSRAGLLPKQPEPTAETMATIERVHASSAKTNGYPVINLLPVPYSKPTGDEMIDPVYRERALRLRERV